MFAFLRSIGLRPLEWTQALKLVKKGTPYVGEVLEAAFREAAAVVVLMTPDDEARLRRKFQKPSDPDYEKRLTGQARPNVLFEAGMAFGKDPNSTVLVQVGDVRPFSDVGGRHVVHLTDQPTSRQEFVTKLANAGCNVDTTGSDWLSAGTFSPR
jgi:predicted nucleotide-binding protein